MALEKQIIPVSLGVGVDTKTDPKQVSQTKLLTLQNGYFQAPKSLKKRPGYKTLSSSTFEGLPITNGAGVASFKSELDTFDGTSLYSYSPTSALNHNVGSYVPMTVSANSIYQGTSFQKNVDSAYHAASGLMAYTWIDSTSSVLRFSVIDYATGDIIVNGTANGVGALTPRVAALGVNFVFIFYSSGSTNIQYFVVPTATPTATINPTTTFTATSKNPGIFDISVSNNVLYLVYSSTSLGGGVVATSMNANATPSGTSVLISAIVPTNCISAMNDSSNNLWIGFASATTVYGAITDSALASIRSATAMETSAGAQNITGAIVTGSSPLLAYYFYESVAGGAVSIHRCGFDLPGNTYTPSTVFYSNRAFLAGRAYYSNNYVFFMVAYISPLQGKYVLMAVTKNPGGTAFSVAKTQGNNLGTVGVNGPTQHHLPNSNLIAGTYEQAINPATQIQTQQGSYIQITGVASFRNSFIFTPETQELSGSLHLTGGILWQYDGGQVVEHGFIQFPEDVTAVVSGAGSIAAGVYQYSAVYEWTDTNGLVHQSAPSVPISVTATGSNTITISTQTTPFTLKQNVHVAIYRTLASGTVFYRMSNFAVPVNNLLGSFVNYDDTVADGSGSTSITGNQQLYTTGGVIEHICAPPALTIATYKSRLMLVPADGRNSIWYSKEIIPSIGVIPGTPVQFSDLLVQNIDQRGGDITGIVQLDDKLIIFKSGLIFFMYGDGPAANGTNNDFSSAQLLAADVGCTVTRSIVSTNLGIFFQSAKGICLLDRSLTVSYIGAEVESFNSLTVVDARLVAKYSHVRFIMSNGTCLVYDYLVNQWSTYLNHPAVAACLVGGLYTYVTAAGVIQQETPVVFVDNASFIPLVITTPWFGFAGLQGFQRVYSAQILGDYKSAHTLQVQVAYDFDPTIVQTETITSTNVTPYQFRILLNRQKCESVQLTIQDLQSSNFGEGMALSDVSFEVGVKQGLNKQKTSQTYG